jgi:fumarylacetoacetase
MQAALRAQSWYQYEEATHFPLENIPFGVYKTATGEAHCCSRVGEFIVDLAGLFPLFQGENFASLNGDNVFNSETLNKFAALGTDFRIEARQTIQNLFTDASKEAEVKAHLVAVEGAQMDLPVFIRDYTDFYSSKNHAMNIGIMFRGKDNALQPNWLHLPVGYHGRASSIVIDGTPITRPKGQVSADGKTPTWSECKRLDFELEMGTVLSRGNKLGTPIKIGDARDHIFGFTMLNDWSCRDLQKWEYVPLGPFLAKNFASTISPWVITPEALSPFKTPLPAQEPAVLPYLNDTDLSAYDIKLLASIRTPQMGDAWHTVSVSNMKHLYFSVAQTIAHHSVTGCNMATGDLLGSGTISSTEESGYGSMVELCWGGQKTIDLPTGEQLKFLRDGDEVNMTGVCEGNGYTIGFGNCSGKILPSLDDSHYF